MDLIDTAKFLADAHRAEDPQTTAVYFVPDPGNSEVRLVEVSESVEATGEVLPFRFRAHPDKGVPFESVVVLLSVDDWKRIVLGELHLPDGWGPIDALEPV